MTTAAKNVRRRVVPVAALIGAGTLLLTACSGSGDGSGGSAPTEFSYLSLAENTAVQDTLTGLSTGACATQQEALPLSITTQPQAGIDQQLQLLGGQGALPVVFAAGNSPQVIKDLDSGGQVLDIGSTFDDLGIADDIIPAAKSTIEALYGSQIVLPTEFNVEGIWYNKKIFADNGIQAPATWDDLLAASDSLKAAGVTPLSTAGKDGWPVTRLLGNYIYRTLGPDAMQKVADGEAKLTDPEYVAAAQAVADLGAAGDFGPSVGSIDYTTAVNQFVNGEAGMFYMGSWILSVFNDPAQNKIGAENIGFIPFPEVEGGGGSSDQLAANIGVPLGMSASAYDEKVGDWLTCIGDNFGTDSLKNQGVITGFTVNTPVADLPPLTQTIQDAAAASPESVLWFEALFNAKATSTSQTNGSQLATGALSPADFMAKVQADLGN
ncbi:extracellular solute-binding protein [Herbiconiux sp.]|uniref:ABC transporter substrate-binding protein n=1 Tax=Herbiconiux sp. TaxID=1871186 RepID=UPI0025C18313|nr:extracellular solute-binding protein [Herbiconiux sp.]